MRATAVTQLASGWRSVRRTLSVATFLAMLAIGTAHAGPLEDGHAAYLHGDIDTALSLWTPLAEQGNAEAQYMLGLIYFNGRYVPKDDGVAAHWLQLSAAQGNTNAEMLLSVLTPADQADMAQGARK
jgi:TPR repeat protein